MRITHVAEVSVEQTIIGQAQQACPPQPHDQQHRGNQFFARHRRILFVNSMLKPLCSDTNLDAVRTLSVRAVKRNFERATSSHTRRSPDDVGRLLQQVQLQG
jgi:hypothetical protein